MATTVPLYIRTEWKGKGHTEIRLADSDCKVCLRNFEVLEEQKKIELLEQSKKKKKKQKKNKPAPAEDEIEEAILKEELKEVELLKEIKELKDIKELKLLKCSHSNVVECHVSNLNIWEYVAYEEINDEEYTEEIDENNEKCNKEKENEEECYEENENEEECYEEKENAEECYEEKENAEECYEDKENDECYEEKENNECYEENENDEECETEDVFIPPTISEDLYNEWLKFWEMWNEFLVDLSWVQRYPQFCKEETLHWYGQNTLDNVVLSQDLKYYNKIELKAEKKALEFEPKSGDEFNKLLDDLYAEHVQTRYWVHFRLYLRDYKVEIGQELKHFFFDFGIVSEPPFIPKNKKSMEEAMYPQGFDFDERLDKITAEKQKNSEELERTNAAYYNLHEDQNETIHEDLQNLDIGKMNVPKDNPAESLSGSTNDSEEPFEFVPALDASRKVNGVSEDHDEQDMDLDYSHMNGTSEKSDEQGGSPSSSRVSENYEEPEESRAFNGETRKEVSEEKDIANGNGYATEDEHFFKKLDDRLDAWSDSDSSVPESITEGDIDYFIDRNMHRLAKPKKKDAMSNGIILPSPSEQRISPSSGENISKNTTDNSIKGSVLSLTKSSKNSTDNSLIKGSVLSATKSSKNSTDYSHMNGTSEKSDEQVGSPSSRRVTENYEEPEESSALNIKGSVLSPPKSKRKPQKPLKYKSGVAWALSHLKENGVNLDARGTSSSNHTSMQTSSISGCLGNSSDASQVDETKLDGQETSSSNNQTSNISESLGNSSDASRVDEQETSSSNNETSLEASIIPGSSGNSSDASQVGEVPKGLKENVGSSVGSVFGTVTSFWRFGTLFSKSFLNLVCFILKANPFTPDHPVFMSFSPYWWLGYSFQDESMVSKLMGKAERESVNVFWKLFRPTIRHITFYPPLFTRESLRWIKVKKFEEKRLVDEHLIKIKKNTNEETKSYQSVSVLDMDEDAVDYEMEELGENPDADYVMKGEDGSKAKYSSQFSALYDPHGNFIFDPYKEKMPVPFTQKVDSIVSNFKLLRFNMDAAKTDFPGEMKDNLVKYWMQRYRYFLRYDEGIQLDHESWFSVTPEMLAVHQAERCRNHTVIDAFCGSGGNAIQLAKTCEKVIAIDKDPEKIQLAKHNAKIYGVEDSIKFITGDFFQCAPSLEADAVFLSPPWGGINYKDEETYDILKLGGMMDGKELYATAKNITPNIAMYLPKNSNVLQLIELAGCGGKVDIEYEHICNKRKSLTAYFGDLANYRGNYHAICK